MLKNPPVLVLDEATSALDSRTEQALQDALERVAVGRTTLVIAHRLSTVIDADEIVVLEHGRVVERGTHVELLVRRGLYADMWHRQQEARRPRRRSEPLGLGSTQQPQFVAGCIGEILQWVDADAAFDQLV